MSCYSQLNNLTRKWTSARGLLESTVGNWLNCFFHFLLLSLAVMYLVGIMKLGKIMGIGVIFPLSWRSTYAVAAFCTRGCWFVLWTGFLVGSNNVLRYSCTIIILFIVNIRIYTRKTSIKIRWVLSYHPSIKLILIQINLTNSTN